MISKQILQKNRIMNEIEVGKKVIHANSIKFWGYLEDQYNFYLIFDWIQGITLLQFLKLRNFKPLKEEQTKKLLFPIVHALLYCHKNEYQLFFILLILII
jgi:serine/threonine protein kinase